MAFALPRYILMGANKVLETPALMKTLKLSRPLIVSDPFVRYHKDGSRRALNARA